MDLSKTSTLPDEDPEEIVSADDPNANKCDFPYPASTTPEVDLNTNSKEPSCSQENFYPAKTDSTQRQREMRESEIPNNKDRPNDPWEQTKNKDCDIAKQTGPNQSKKKSYVEIEDSTDYQEKKCVEKAGIWQSFCNRRCLQDSQDKVQDLSEQKDKNKHETESKSDRAHSLFTEEENVSAERGIGLCDHEKGWKDSRSMDPDLSQQIEANDPESEVKDQDRIENSDEQAKTKKNQDEKNNQDKSEKDRKREAEQKYWDFPGI